MKTIIFSADDGLIGQARRQALLKNTTLNDLCRTWLERYGAPPGDAESYPALMAALAHVCARSRFLRAEMNERR